MDLDAALDFARANRFGVLATLKAKGRPQLSNILYGVDESGLIRVSITDGLAKTANIRRDPRVSLHITSADYWPYAVIEGNAVLSEVSTEHGDAVSLELAEMYRAASGEHEDWDDFYRAMVDDRRLVLSIHPTSAYGSV